MQGLHVTIDPGTVLYTPRTGPQASRRFTYAPSRRAQRLSTESCANDLNSGPVAAIFLIFFVDGRRPRWVRRNLRSQPAAGGEFVPASGARTSVNGAARRAPSPGSFTGRFPNDQTRSRAGFEIWKPTELRGPKTTVTTASVTASPAVPSVRNFVPRAGPTMLKIRLPRSPPRRADERRWRLRLPPGPPVGQCSTRPPRITSHRRPGSDAADCCRDRTSRLRVGCRPRGPSISPSTGAPSRPAAAWSRAAPLRGARLG